MVINNSKEIILKHIKDALKDTPSEEINLDNIFLENFGDSSKSILFKQFKEELLKVSGEIVELKKSDELLDKLEILFNKNKYENFIIWETDFIKGKNIKKGLEGRGFRHNKSRSLKKLADTSVGITEVDYAIADTGTLVLFSNNNKPRIPSVLTPVHIAILNKENILSNIHQLFFEIKKDHKDLTDISSCMTFITGPSRTADIELSLTLGVHGPGRLIVFVV